MRIVRVAKRAVAHSRDFAIGVAAVVAFVVLLACIAANVDAQKGNEGAVEAFIPVEAECLVQVRFAALWNSDFGKLWREVVPSDPRFGSFRTEPSYLKVVNDDGAFFAWTRGPYFITANAKGGDSDLAAFMSAYPF